MTTKSELVARRDLLFDYLANQPLGATNPQIREDLGLTKKQLDNTIRDLRLFCGETDEINLVCDPQGRGEFWLYKLIGNLEAARPWQNNQIKHLETRLKTSCAVAKSLVAGVDGRTYDGKKVRRIALVLGRLIEDLEELAPSP